MKDPKNIEILNKLVMHYITLHGLQSVSLEPDDPFAQYFVKILTSGLTPMNGAIVTFDSRKIIKKLNEGFYVPNSVLHPMIKLAYEFYKEIDDFDNEINPMMKEQISYQLGDIKFDDFVENSIDTYKSSLFELLINYNSKKEEYNQIKLDILTDKMNEAIEIEDYELAAEMRDKISDIKKLI